MATKQQKEAELTAKLETAEKRILEIKDEMISLKEEMTKIMLDITDTANKAVCDGLLDFEVKENNICSEVKSETRKVVRVLLNVPVIGRKPTDILYTLEKMTNITKALIDDKDYVAIILNDDVRMSNNSIWEYALDNEGKFSPKSAKHYYHTHILPYIEEADILVTPNDTYNDIVCDVTRESMYTQIRFNNFGDHNKTKVFYKFDKRVIDVDDLCIKPYKELNERYYNNFKEIQECVNCKENAPCDTMPDFLK